MMNVLDFIRKLFLVGLEGFGIYYGVYRATVWNNKDPQKRGRIQVTLHELGQQEPSNLWFVPSFFSSCGKGRGTFWVPDVGDTVYVRFDGGNPSRPKCYFGGWFAENEVPTDLQPDAATLIPYKKGMVTRLGHRLVFNEQPGKESVKLIWSKPASSDLAIQNTVDGLKETAKTSTSSNAFVALSGGGILLANQAGSLFNLGTNDETLWLNTDGSFIRMNANGITIVTNVGTMIDLSGPSINIIAPTSLNISSPTVTLSTAGIFVGPNNTELLSWLRLHQHNSGVGPTTPPIQQNL